MDELDIMRCPIELTETAKRFVEMGEASCGEDTFAIEEAAEYIQALCKVKRYISDFAKTPEKRYMIDYSKQDLAQEMAHVYLTLNHIRTLYGIDLDMIQSFMDIKIQKYGLPVYKEKT